MCSTERDSSDLGLVAKITALLSAFTPTDRELSGAELARRARLPRSTAHRVIGDLVTEGLLERTAGGRYQLGMQLFELGQMAPRQRGLSESAAPFLTDLRDATRETVHLAVMDGFEVVYVDIIRSTQGPRLQSRVGGRMPATATGVGKAILAFTEQEILDAVIENGLARLTHHSIVSASRLRAELETIRQSGTAYDNQENTHGTTCCASPVFGPNNRVIAAISVSGHTSALKVERVAAAVRSTAMAISRAQGSTRPLFEPRPARRPG